MRALTAASSENPNSTPNRRRRLKARRGRQVPRAASVTSPAQFSVSIDSERAVFPTHAGEAGGRQNPKSTKTPIQPQIARDVVRRMLGAQARAPQFFLRMWGEEREHASSVGCVSPRGQPVARPRRLPHSRRGRNHSVSRVCLAQAGRVRAVFSTHAGGRARTRVHRVCFGASGERRARRDPFFRIIRATAAGA